MGRHMVDKTWPGVRSSAAEEEEQGREQEKQEEQEEGKWKMTVCHLLTQSMGVKQQSILSLIHCGRISGKFS